MNIAYYFDGMLNITKVLDNFVSVETDRLENNGITDFFIIDDDKIPTDRRLRDYWELSQDKKTIVVSDNAPKIAKQELELALKNFADEKDIDIAEIPMLLNSDNIEWKAEAKHFQALYLSSWEAFYDGQPLPELAW